LTQHHFQGYDEPVKIAAEIIKNSSFTGDIFLKEPMNNRCTFKTGGPAEVLVIPKNLEDILLIRKICRENKLPLFILGGGANILVSDKGIPGVTLSMEKITHIERQDNSLICEAGLSVNSLVKKSLEEELTGLEFLNRLPGSVGGALYMNARCYGSEIADVLAWAEILTPEDKILTVPFKRGDWEYKSSPFQKENLIILRAAFNLCQGKGQEINEKMDEISKSRLEKGHFKAPSAGSTFKNNRLHGKPAGRLIDECGLKGLVKGKASVSSWHGNIIINTGHATSHDISDLIIEVQNKVLENTGFELEPEVIRVGNWD
jgi:UDP-N-acetylmuramate dehydrogenase